LTFDFKELHWRLKEYPMSQKEIGHLHLLFHLIQVRYCHLSKTILTQFMERRQDKKKRKKKKKTNKTMKYFTINSEAVCIHFQISLLPASNRKEWEDQHFRIEANH
jgi:hypothetical protein